MISAVIMLLAIATHFPESAVGSSESIRHEKALLVADVEDAVPDEASAIRIAKATLAERFGEKAMHFQEPYHAHLEGDTWSVVGDPHLPPNSSGGGVRVDISKKTGRVVAIGSEA